MAVKDYLEKITSDLKDTNKRLVRENEALAQEVLKLKEYIKLLENSEYVGELEARVSELESKLKREQASYGNLKGEVEALGEQLDSFLALFANHIDSANSDEIDISEDRSLLFGVNLDSNLIQNATIKALKNYLYILKCNKIQIFNLNDFYTDKKSDIVLIGEVFADYIRLAHLTKNSNIYGLVEISMPDMFAPHSIRVKFYGNKDIKSDFAKFKQIYSKELKLENTVR